MPVDMNPVSTIKIHLGLEPNGPAQKYFTNACYRRMTKYVPKDEGNLRRIVDIGEDSITYESPYARYQYYGERLDGSHKVKHYTTPGTGKYWDKRMKSVEMKSLTKEMQTLFGRR